MKTFFSFFSGVYSSLSITACSVVFTDITLLQTIKNTRVMVKGVRGWGSDGTSVMLTFEIC